MQAGPWHFSALQQHWSSRTPFRQGPAALFLHKWHAGNMLAWFKCPAVSFSTVLVQEFHFKIYLLILTVLMILLNLWFYSSAHIFAYLQAFYAHALTVVSLTSLSTVQTRLFQKYCQYQFNNMVICGCIFQRRETWTEKSHCRRLCSKGFPTKRATLTKFELILGWWWKLTEVHRPWSDGGRSGRWLRRGVHLQHLRGLIHHLLFCLRAAF